MRCKTKGCNRDKDFNRRSCRRCYVAKKKYNIDQEKLEELLQVTNCSICHNELIDKPHHERQYCIDHCHKTGRVRGALCRKCNLLLGYAQDDPTILLNSIKYLWDNLEEAN